MGTASQPWSDSVRGLAHYPVVVEWMAQNLLWVQALGAAVADQPEDVMTAIQRLRGQALAAGTLGDTPQQQVVEEDGLIEILPVAPDVIYVPSYDPDVVYAAGVGEGPFLFFGTALPDGRLDLHQYGFDLASAPRSGSPTAAAAMAGRPGLGPPGSFSVPAATPGRPREEPAGAPAVCSSRPRPTVIRPKPMPGAPLARPADAPVGRATTLAPADRARAPANRRSFLPAPRRPARRRRLRLPGRRPRALSVPPVQPFGAAG